MQNNALYFPYISIPNESWTIKTLLYWDGLASIVPMDHVYHPELLSPFMRELLHADLVQQVFPSEFLWQINGFEKSFINLVKTKVEHQKRFKGKGWVQSAQSANNLVKIHAEKMGYIPDFLIEQGLAKSCDKYGWYLVEKNVAKLFMCYLATCLGSIKSLNAVPVTNTIQNTTPFGNAAVHNRFLNHHRQKARNIVLKDLLPVPNEKVSLDDLLKFKNDHGHLLPSLRLMVENHCAEISQIKDPLDRINCSEQFLAESNIVVQEITDAMKPTWSKVTFGSLIPVAAAGLAMSAGEPGLTTGYIAGGASFLANAYNALTGIQEPQNRIESKPLAYVAHANLRLG